jgi:hypothetical protein
MSALRYLVIAISKKGTIMDLALMYIQRSAALPTPGDALLPFYFPGGALPLKKNIFFIFKKTHLLVIYDTSYVWEPPKVS